LLFFPLPRQSFPQRTQPLRPQFRGFLRVSRRWRRLGLNLSLVNFPLVDPTLVDLALIDPPLIDPALAGCLLCSTGWPVKNTGAIARAAHAAAIDPRDRRGAVDQCDEGGNRRCPDYIRHYIFS
jgi:hypothetical protein